MFSAFKISWVIMEVLNYIKFYMVMGDREWTSDIKSFDGNHFQSVKDENKML